MNVGYAERKIMNEAITVGEIRAIREKIQIGSRLPVLVYNDMEGCIKRGHIKVGRVISKHRNLVCLDIGTSVTYVQIAQYLRAKANNPNGKPYIK